MEVAKLLCAVTSVTTDDNFTSPKVLVLLGPTLDSVNTIVGIERLSP